MTYVNCTPHIHCVNTLASEPQIYKSVHHFNTNTATIVVC